MQLNYFLWVSVSYFSNRLYCNLYWSIWSNRETI